MLPILLLDGETFIDGTGIKTALGMGGVKAWRIRTR